MTAVIFGGSGFVGRHLAHWLVAHGEDDVLLADLEPPAYPAPEHVRFERCDVREPITLDVALEPAVYNLAAVHRTPGHEDHEYFDTNVAGARNVADFAARHGVRSLTFTSTIAVHEPSERVINEATPTNPSSAYGASKLEAEQIQIEWAHAAPDRALVIVRSGAVFGPGEGGNFTRLAAALKRHRFVYPGRRDTAKGCGYVIDLIESLAFVQPLAAPVVIYHFGLPRSPTIEEVCRALADVGGFSPPRVVVPTSVMLGAARALNALGSSNYVADRVRKLVQSTDIVPELLLREGYPYRFDLRGALADWYASEPSGEFV